MKQYAVTIALACVFTVASFAGENHRAKYTIGMTSRDAANLLPKGSAPSVTLLSTTPPAEPEKLETEAQSYVDATAHGLRLFFNYHGKLIKIEDLSKSILDASAKQATSWQEELPGEAKAIALQAISVLYLQPDAARAAKFIHDEAVWKDHGAGSLRKNISDIKKLEGTVDEKLSVREILFFSKKDIPSLRKRFPYQDGMWTENRIPAHLSDALGCLCVYRVRGNNDPADVGLGVLVLKRIGYEWKIVYADDN